MNSLTYLTIAYKRNCVLQKLELNKNWWKNKDRDNGALVDLISKYKTNSQCWHKQSLNVKVNWLQCFEILFIVIVIEIVIELQLHE